MDTWLCIKGKHSKAGLLYGQGHHKNKDEFMKILDLRIFIIIILMPMFLFPAIGQPNDYLYDEVIGRYSMENTIIFDTNF